MIVRLPCFLALRSPLLIASRMEVSPIPVRALASSGDTGAVPRAVPFPSARTRSSLSPLSFAGHNGVASLVSLVLDLRFRHRRQSHAPPWRSLVQRPIKSASENVIIPHMMQWAVPKQNGCQKCVVQLDTKANERRGSRSPISSPLLRAIAATNFWSLGRSPHHCEGDQPLIS